MSKKQSQQIVVQGAPISILTHNDQDFICLTDMARANGGDGLVEKWLCNRNTIEFLGVWETLYNPSFNSPEFGGIKAQTGSNRFFISVKQWVSKTSAKGLFARAGRHNSGTFAHRDIAFEFGSWISPEFKLYLIKEFQRLKEDEAGRNNIDWDLSRFLSKANYRIHTDAIKERLIPSLNLAKEQEGFVYANEADMLHKAVFGVTNREWDAIEAPRAKAEKRHPKTIRDGANVIQLLILSNLESTNADLVNQGLSRVERFKRLEEIARRQYVSLENSHQLSKKVDGSIFPGSKKLTMPEGDFTDNIKRIARVPPPVK